MTKKNIIEKYKGMTFAQASEKIASKYKNKDTDAIERNSYEVELDALAAYQEKLKTVQQMAETVKQFKMGGKLQYGNGTPPDGLSEDEFGIMNPPVPPTLTSINTLDNQALPQVNTLGTNNVPQYTVGERLGKMANNLFGNQGNQNSGSGEMNAYTPALIGQGISTALDAGLLLGGYDKVAPVENPYESQITNNMASRSIDSTQQRNQILSAYNAAKGNLGNVRSANVRNALDANLMNVTQDNLAESKLQEQQINQGYKADYANVLNNLGQQKAGARTYAEQLNTDSKSNWQSGVSELGKHLADMGLSQTTLKLNNAQQTAIANIMSQKYPDFMIGEAALKSYLNGTYTNEEFVKLKEAATKNPELQSILDFATFQKQQKENTK